MKKLRTCFFQVFIKFSKKLLTMYIACKVIEGLCAKRAYIKFWPIFIFCRIKLIFGRHEKHGSLIVLVDWRFVLQK